jgi:hypothetical protein
VSRRESQPRGFPDERPNFCCVLHPSLAVIHWRAGHLCPPPCAPVSLLKHPRMPTVSGDSACTSDEKKLEACSTMNFWEVRGELFDFSSHKVDVA